MANSYASALYKSMVDGLSQVRAEDPSVKPSGMAAILVLMRRTDYKQDGDSTINFVHVKSGQTLTINPTSSFNEVITQMAQLELPTLIGDDWNTQVAVTQRLQKLMNAGDPMLNMNPEDIKAP